MTTDDRSGPPHELLFATDPARALADLVALPLSLRLGRRAPRGSGQPVLVLPGLLAGDLSTLPLRSFLRGHGFSVHGWQLGANVGPTPRVEAGLIERVDRIAQEHGRPVALVGWSLGGIYARLLAADVPELVAQVVTLGTPFAMDHAGQTRAQGAYDRFKHLHTPGRGLPVPAAVRGPLPVPATSVWSRHDGIVSWRTSLERPSPTAENIAVLSSHLGLGHNAGVLFATADRLAQAPGRWQPFRAPHWLRPLFPPVGEQRPAAGRPAAGPPAAGLPAAGLPAAGRQAPACRVHAAGQ